MSLLATNEKPLLKKHVNSIHCSNNLTLVQRKLFNALLYNAYHDLPEKTKYQITIKKLCELIGYDSRDYKKLKKSLLELITTAIEWNVIDQDSGEQQDKWRASAIISAVKIESGICTYEFSSIMRELLYAPEIYGKIDIKLMIKFKSSYGLALYENCIRFQGIAQTQWLNIQVFRKLMGIPENNYPNFCDFKKRVLDVAVKEVNTYAPIEITPEIQRANKKVVSIRFKLVNKKRGIENKEYKETVFSSEVDLMEVLKKQFGFSEDGVLDLCQKYESSYIRAKVNLIKTSGSFATGRIRELAAYLIDALKRDYQPSKSNQHVLAEERRINENLRIQERYKQNQSHSILCQEKRQNVDSYLNQLSQSEKNALIGQFDHYLYEKDQFYLYKKYQEVGMESYVIRAMFYAFVSEKLNQLST